MKAVPLTIHWHEHNQPIYSAHFEPNGKGRLATAGGDNNVRVCLTYLPQCRPTEKSQFQTPETDRD